MFSIGQIVFSKSGRDRGRPFVIFASEGEYIYLVDGYLRKIDKPKKKKAKHVQPVNEINYNLKDRIENNLPVADADVKKVLAAFKNEEVKTLCQRKT